MRGARHRLQRCANAVDKVRAHPAAEPFQILPPRQQFPDYYRVVKKPTSLKTIRTYVRCRRPCAWRCAGRVP